MEANMETNTEAKPPQQSKPPGGRRERYYDEDYKDLSLYDD